jgi:hypothetical protein
MTPPRRPHCGIPAGPAALALLATLAGTACYSYRAALVPPPQGAAVRMRFDPARSMLVALPGRDTVLMRNVRTLDGYVVGVRGDTLQLELIRLRALGYRRGTVTVAPQPGRPPQLRRLSVVQSAGAILAAAAVVAAGIFAGIGVAQSGG